jgi:putative ABC transport system permease protein
MARQFIGSVYYELRLALRMFARDRRFSLAAFAAIALAVGGATGTFSVADRSLFRPLPYRDGDRLVSVGVIAPLLNQQPFALAGMYRDWRAERTPFLEMTSWKGTTACDEGEDVQRRLSCAPVEASFLPVLGVEPLIGRNLSVADDQPGAPPVALISYRLWRDRFGADPKIVGSNVTLDGARNTIIGVLPAGFETPDLSTADVLVPEREPGPKRRNVMIRMIARLAPGYTAISAAGAVDGLFQSWWNSLPLDLRHALGSARLRVETLRDQQIRDYRAGLWMLLGAVAAFLLIACANVANLLLARSARRRQEFAVRAALGASRWRLARQVLSESALLGVAGGAAGCVLAEVLLRVAVALAPDGTIRLRQASLDPRVLLFAFAITVAASLAFSLAAIVERLRGENLTGSRTTARRTWLRQTLVCAQLAISLTLLTGSGLLLANLNRLRNAPLGFGKNGVVTASFILPRARYSDGYRAVNFFNQLEERIKMLPGAAASAISDTIPPGNDNEHNRPYVGLANPGGNASDPNMGGEVRWRYVTPGYFAALGVPIRRGRDFSEADRAMDVKPVIMSRSLAKRLHGDENPVGKIIASSNPSFVVVGVAGDVQNSGLGGASELEMYLVRERAPVGIFENQGGNNCGWCRAVAIVRSSLNERATEDLLLNTIHGLDPGIEVATATMNQHVDRYLVRPRFESVLLSAFALNGLLLAAIGLYGLASFLVADRTREIGIRMAIGATRRDVIGLLMAAGMRWTAAGTLFGLICSAGLTRLLKGMLYDVRTDDPRVFVIAALVLFVIAMLATFLPSRHASRIDPMIALRHE